MRSRGATVSARSTATRPVVNRFVAMHMFPAEVPIIVVCTLLWHGDKWAVLTIKSGYCFASTAFSAPSVRWQVREVHCGWRTRGVHVATVGAVESPCSYATLRASIRFLIIYRRGRSAPPPCLPDPGVRANYDPPRCSCASRSAGPWLCSAVARAGCRPRARRARHPSERPRSASVTKAPYS